MTRMERSATKIDQDKLRAELIEVYSGYLTKKRTAIEKAMKLDGLWSGAFLLDEDIEAALNNLTNLYVKPTLSKKRAREILSRLQELSKTKKRKVKI